MDFVNLYCYKGSIPALKPALFAAIHMYVSAMEPLLPPEGDRSLEDLAMDLTARANRLAGLMHPRIQASVGALVRSMNCYYSNLIEGHDTHPRDIDRALAQNYSAEPARRALQLEAVAHIAVQTAIDEGEDIADWPATGEYARWLHQEFCRRLPDELLWVENPDTGERLRVEPGTYRERQVQVGRHLPPDPDDLPRFMDRFALSYAPSALSRLRQIQSVAAVHHRFLWIHPFLDGNGRVARLMSHALLKRQGVGASLWSPARGLARDVGRYKALLTGADEPRRGDLDGRGALSEAGLLAFCSYFLTICLDQVDYMASILEPSELLRRIELYVEDETRAGRLPKGTYPLLREAVLAGEVERGRAPELTGYQERAARTVVARLLELGLLVSSGHRDRLRLGFPIDVVERWFPRLYPTN